MHLFEKILSVCVEDIKFQFNGYPPVDWSNFVLNPRRLRGSDFLMRWSQGVWSEERIIQAVNLTGESFAIPYGPSGTAPDDDVRAFELYFERLEAAGLGKIKRPDLLIFKKADQGVITKLIEGLGGISELPFTAEENKDMQQILSKAMLAVECENSLWKGSLMPDYGAELKPQKRLNDKLGLKKNAVLPTIIMKEEDREPLQAWQDNIGIPIHIWHVFFDMAFGISLDEAQRLIRQRFVPLLENTLQSLGGETTKKSLYEFSIQFGYQLGDFTEEPHFLAKSITDKHGHVFPYVSIGGGKIKLHPEALGVLQELAHK
jgi:hypothetical protein